ncbi:MAG: tRNA (adenosine(37)-N6)-threonylcarbamoyltransferase complex ATPase subunit type 1 TsaE [Spirochaetes bacterium]|nr:tRNA (adenosine(37)-N6)-threonylcarbamoyltransferase complex ATPase subunit type 1 TsaE [Spirochaetota bacterium]
MAIAREMGAGATPGTVLALVGGLGTGKTVFARGLAEGMGIAGEITSPTYTLLDVHEGRIPLYHFDLYRIEKSEELDRLFFEEYWEGDGVSVIEWADRALDRLPDGHIRITLDYLDETRRSITIETTGA